MKHIYKEVNGVVVHMCKSDYYKGQYVVGWMNTKNNTGGQRCYKSKARAMIKLLMVALLGK